MNRLHKLLSSGKDEVPATKEERKTKREEIKVDQNKKKAKLAQNKDRQITYRNQLSNLQIEKRAAQKNFTRRNNFITVIRGVDSGEIIKSDGSKVKLIDFNSTVAKTIKDYEGDNVSKKDSDIGNGTGNEKSSTSLSTLVAYANTFLARIPTHLATYELDQRANLIQSPSLSTEFNDRQ